MIKAQLPLSHAISPFPSSAKGSGYLFNPEVQPSESTSFSNPSPPMPLLTPEHILQATSRAAPAFDSSVIAFSATTVTSPLAAAAGQGQISATVQQSPRPASAVPNAGPKNAPSTPRSSGIPIQGHAQPKFDSFEEQTNSRNAPKRNSPRSTPVQSPRNTAAVRKQAASPSTTPPPNQTRWAGGSFHASPAPDRLPLPSGILFDRPDAGSLSSRTSSNGGSPPPQDDSILHVGPVLGATSSPKLAPSSNDLRQMSAELKLLLGL